MNLDSKCISQCEGCGHNKSGLCEVFLCPEAKFRSGGGSCGMSTHLVTRIVEDKIKVRHGQQKSKKKTRSIV